MRLFSLAVGLGAGLLIGASVVRRVDAARRAVAPTQVAGRAGQAAGSFAERLRVAVADGRAAAAEQERVLRARYRVPSLLPGDEPAR